MFTFYQRPLFGYGGILVSCCGIFYVFPLLFTLMPFKTSLQFWEMEKVFLERNHGFWVAIDPLKLVSGVCVWELSCGEETTCGPGQISCYFLYPASFRCH